MREIISLLTMRKGENGCHHQLQSAFSGIGFYSSSAPPCQVALLWYHNLLLLPLTISAVSAPFQSYLSLHFGAGQRFTTVFDVYAEPEVMP